MLSKRDNLLIRPWQQRRFENHRRKVQSALPAIDSRTPTYRGHVCCKLKRKQTEKERCVQIESDNLRLLQKMQSIMKKNRLDNHWRTPQPTFLNRVKMYKDQRPNTTTHTDYNTKDSHYYINVEELSISNDNGNDQQSTDARKNRKLKNNKCSACNPSHFTSSCAIYDERLLPWEEEHRNKLKYSPPSSSSTKTSNINNNNNNNNGSDNDNDDKQQNMEKRRNIMMNKLKNVNNTTTSTPCILLKHGNLHLVINFPSDTNVVLKKDGHVEKVIMTDLCQCTSLHKS